MPARSAATDSTAPASRRAARGAGAALAAAVALALAARPLPAAALTLEECFRIADESSPGLAAAQAGRAAAAAAAREARADLRPRLDARASAARLSEAPEARFPPLVPGGAPLSVPLGERDLRRAELAAGWVAFAGGALRERARIGGLEAEGASLLAEAARADLRLEVARAYYALLLARRRGQLLEEERRRVDEHRAVAAAFFEEGATTRGDVLAADVAVARIDLASVRAAADERLAAAGLNLLLGRAAAEPLDPREPGVGEAPPPAPPREEALAAMRSGRAELRAARLREEAASRAVRAAAGGRWPRVSVGASWYLASEGAAGDPGAGGWQVAALAEWGVLDFGRVAAAVDRAEAEALRASFERRRLEQYLALEVEAALLAREAAEQERAAAAAAVTQAAESRRVARELYREASGTAADVLDAETAHAAAAAAADEARYGAWVAAWELRRATGAIAAGAGR